jgi:hypothetical protein
MTETELQTKPWWQSRTVWAAVVGLIYPVLNSYGILPEALTSESMLETVMVAVSAAALYFRIQAEKKLTVIETWGNKDEGQ